MPAAAFEALEITHGPSLDLSQDAFPTLAGYWRGEPGSTRAFAWDQLDATWFGYVHAGPATLTCDAGVFTLRPGMYFSVPGPGRVEGTGFGMLIARLGYRGFFHLGGPVEDTGRLRYIDGCRDSLLIPPVMLGDPCLNLLHLPPHTNQSQHTHPSNRLGLIIRGEGECRTPQAVYPLRPGLPFLIRQDGLHSFFTRDQDLLVLAWHPDSDCGPTHENHPMVNRTILAGR